MRTARTASQKSEFPQILSITIFGGEIHKVTSTIVELLIFNRLDISFVMIDGEGTEEIA